MLTSHVYQADKITSCEMIRHPIVVASLLLKSASRCKTAGDLSISSTAACNFEQLSSNIARPSAGCVNPFVTKKACAFVREIYWLLRRFQSESLDCFCLQEI